MALVAGRLNRRVILQTASLASDGGGGSTATWASTATVWARVEPLTGREAFEGMQTASRLSHRVIIRKRAVAPTQRVKYGAQIFLIRAVMPDERDEATELLCEEAFI